MFQLFHDSKRNIIFILKQKCGSSALGQMVADGKIYKEIISFVSINDIISMPPETPIVMTLREPEAAYFAGMNQILKTKKLHNKNWRDGSTVHVTEFSKQLKPFIRNWENELPSYDFNDGHCSHGLWLMLILLLSQRKVEVIKMTDWSDYLIKHYPKNKKHWEHLHSDTSLLGPSSHMAAEELDSTSKTAFRNIVTEPQKDSNSPYTWKLWMGKEKENFNAIMHFLEDGETKHLKQALNIIANDSTYWLRPRDRDAAQVSVADGIRLAGTENLPDSILLLARQHSEKLNA